MKFRSIRNERLGFGKDGMTQAELGQLLGKTAAVISNIETGVTGLSLQDAAIIASHFDFSLDWFIGRDVLRHNHRPSAVAEAVIAALPKAIERGEVDVPQYLPDWAAGHNFADALRNRHRMGVQEALNFVLRTLDKETECPSSKACKDRQYVFSFLPICNWASLDKSWRDAFCAGIKRYGFTMEVDQTQGTITVRW